VNNTDISSLGTAYTIGAINPATSIRISTGAGAGNVLVSNASGVGTWKTPNVANYQPADPLGTTSASFVQMGLASTISFTPAISGIIVVTLAGSTVQGGTGASEYYVDFGTGVAPVNGTAFTGTKLTPTYITGVAG